jgi:hypothetical protein
VCGALRASSGVSRRSELEHRFDDPAAPQK